MIRKFVIVAMVVFLAAIGVFSAAKGAGSWQPYHPIDQDQNGMNLSNGLLSAGIADLQVEHLRQQLDMAEDDKDDIELPDIDPEDGEDEYNPEDDPYCNGTATSLHPVGEKLAALYEVTYEDILGWHCLGWGFGEISIAYTISLDKGTPVADLFAMHEGGMGWGEIMMEIGYAPGDFPKKLKFTASAKKWCEGDLTALKIEKLAAKLGLTTEEVTQWLCEEGASIGTLQKAAALTAELDTSLDEILAKRQDGMSWGEIYKEYGKIPAKLDKGGGPDQPDVQSSPRNSKGKGNKNGLEKNGKSKP